MGLSTDPVFFDAKSGARTYSVRPSNKLIALRSALEAAQVPHGIAFHGSDCNSPDDCYALANAVIQGGLYVSGAVMLRGKGAYLTPSKTHAEGYTSRNGG